LLVPTAPLPPAWLSASTRDPTLNPHVIFKLQVGIEHFEHGLQIGSASRTSHNHHPDFKREPER
jgi:hypothetical protein